MSKLTLPVPTSPQVPNSGNPQDGEKTVGFFNYECEPGFTVRIRRDIDATMDPKKLKRILSNRISAQRSRWKKQQYIEHLEMKIKELEMQRRVRISKLEMLSKENQRLQMEHMELQERAFAMHQRCLSAQAETEDLTMMLREAGEDVGSLESVMQHLV